MNFINKSDYDIKKWNELSKYHKQCNLKEIFHEKEIKFLNNNYPDLKDSLSLLNKRDISTWSNKSRLHFFKR